MFDSFIKTFSKQLKKTTEFLLKIPKLIHVKMNHRNFGKQQIVNWDYLRKEANLNDRFRQD